MVRTQRPTLQNIRIRSTLDAHKIFYSVYQGHLEMVTRRLDADERMALGSGCVYAWEERGPHTEITGLGIERFTEGRRWSPSRVRDEFLFYYEKYTPPESAAGQASGSDKPQAPKDWDPLVKQTYSVWIDTEKGRRKWHLTAYFTQLTVDNLGTIDNIPGVGDLAVPEGMFKSTRVNKSRTSNNKALDESSVSSSSVRGNDTASGSGSGSTSTPAQLVTRTYAPFPAPYPYAVVTSNPVPMYEPYPAYPQQLSQIPQPLQNQQHPQQLVLLPRPQVPEHILEHQPPHSHYTLAAVTPGNSTRHLPLPTRTPYQNGNRVEYTHDPSVRYISSSAPSSSPRIIAGAPPGSAYVPNHPMTTSYGAPGPPDHTMYSSVQSLSPPLPHGPHSHLQQQSPSSPWYDEQHQHHPQSSPGPYSSVESISPRPGPEYGEQSPPSNTFESPSPVVPTLVPLNLSSVRTPAETEYTLVDNNNSHSSTASMSPMSPVSPTSPTSPMTPLHPMPPTSRIPPMPSMTPMPVLPPPVSSISSPHPNTPPNPVHSPVYQSMYTIPRGMPSTYLYSSTYTMTPAFQYSPGGAAAVTNPATIASIAYMGERAATPASPSTESSASGSVRSGGSGGSVRSMRSTGSAGSGGSVYVPSSSSLYGPGVPGVSSSRASVGDLRTNELVRSAELVRLSEPGHAVGSAGGGDAAGGSLSGSPQRAVPLPPLHSLKRSHPYRRHPEDDKTLRLLDPRPVSSVP